MQVSGEQALAGWRARVADVVATPAERYTPLTAQRARALVGWVFLALSVVYVVRTLRDMARQG
ncbi:hypothetical protein [Miltoncostaea oceani]|jgi:hypothetical protein|uniref:hypothetical protein n=1 Tax=Miltoncostaea oceani TaxID=2843216 RepID=UPI001C3C5794|nr:hypothetical protein [Miltoncostaea oceani]